VLHVDTAHWLFNNTAECLRLQDLQARRGFVLLPQRQLAPNLAIEHADYATVLGNDFTMSTYRYANKPLFRVPVSSPLFYPWQSDKDFDRVKRHFLWFGSNGFVHKGLDLVLEAFAGMPDYRLKVCGPLRVEPQFQARYHRELYETPNIETLGWIDTEGPEFLAAVSECVGIVFPSCSEGGGAGVITCMQAGLIPIVTRETSVDVDETRGIVLESCAVEDIRAAVQRLARTPGRELEAMARRNMEFARTYHSRQRFAETYAKVVAEIAGLSASRRNAAEAAYVRKVTSVLKDRCERIAPDPGTCGSHDSSGTSLL
jgi:glycosyltransferase involved in cell wall biosynthesis